MSDFTVVISRYELYPYAPVATMLVIGYTATRPCGRTFYTEATVPLQEIENKSTEDIVALGWQQVASRVTTWNAECQAAQSPILGSVFVPPPTDTTTQSDDTPTDTTPTDATATDTAPTDTTQPDATPTDTTPTETTPTDTTPTDTTP